MALRWKSDGSGYTWTPDVFAPMPASAHAQAGAFTAVRLLDRYICPRCTVEAIPAGQRMCAACASELRRIVRVTRAGGDAYEGEEE